jgi:hypothetical protein
MMKTCETSLKQSTRKRGKKITRWKDPNPGKKKKSLTGVDHEGNMNRSSTQIPLSQGTYEIRRGEEHLKEHLA